MAEYIEREHLISELRSLHEQDRLELMGVFDCVKSVPAVEVATDISTMLKIIPDDYTFYDGFVYVICENECKKFILNAEIDKPISLRDCYEMFPSKHLKEGEWLSLIVIYEDWTHGDIFRYGNHGEYWEKIGETIGFA